MPSHIRGIDHVLIAVRELEAAARDWRRLGFVTTPYGRHVGRSTGNACIMFPHDYLELIGIVDETAAPSQHDAVIRARGEGLFAAALSPSGAEQARAAVIAAGIEALPLRDLHRTVERPDGPADLYFKNFDLPDAATPDFRFFFCHHLTPEAMRHPDWLNHPNGVIGLHGIAVVSPEPARLAEAYGRLFGYGSLTETDDVLAVHIGRHRMLFADDDDLRDMYAEVRLPPAPAAAYGAVVIFRVADPGITAACLSGSGISFARSGDSLLVRPENATGVLVEFRPER
jgi:catechol 2,3-dioxygenase-like lactoylglutathione lyase family enzyme